MIKQGSANAVVATKQESLMLMIVQKDGLKAIR